jgi:peptide/nickel transport system substrate-binding protein
MGDDPRPQALRRVSVKAIGGLFVAAVLAAAIVALPGGSTASGQEGGKDVLTIGMLQGIDSMNPVRGVTVAAFEAWNMVYPTLTDKAAKDFGVIPGLATKWEGSDDGKTWTYTLRPGMKWSDGQPLTAEDVAYTINRSRDEEWLNHSATTANLTATTTSPTEVVIKSKVPDPKLPTMDVYIVPKHVYEQYDAKALTKWNGQTDVAAGPYQLAEFKKGQFARFAANPNFWGGKPSVDEVVIRKFNNADAMVAALKRGEVDFVQNVPEGQFLNLQKDPDFVTLEGRQGGFDEFAINMGDGLKKPHPALLDPKVREAIAHAIDKRTIVDRVLRGLGEPAEAVCPYANPDWTPDIPEDQRFDFDLEKSKQILDDAGYKDTDGDGIREMPGGGQPLNFRYAVRSESDPSPRIAEFITGWLKEIGIGTTQKTYDDGQLTEVIGKGDYDMFVWGWTPFVDPDPMLSYFTCDQVSSDPDDPSNYYNDANLCDPEYDKLYKRQATELDPTKRMDIVHEMLTRFYSHAGYLPLYYQGDLQAYRKDRFTGWQKQPADIGPVLFSNSSPSYQTLKLASATTGGASGGGDDGGGGTGIIIALVAVGAVGAGGLLWARSRRASADERE